MTSTPGSVFRWAFNRVAIIQVVAFIILVVFSASSGWDVSAEAVNGGDSFKPVGVTAVNSDDGLTFEQSREQSREQVRIGVAAKTSLVILLMRAEASGLGTEEIVSALIRAGASPAQVVYLAITEGFNSPAVVRAAIKMGVPAEVIFRSAINAGADEVVVARAAVELGANPAEVAGVITDVTTPARTLP